MFTLLLHRVPLPMILCTHNLLFYQRLANILVHSCCGMTHVGANLDGRCSVSQVIHFFNHVVIPAQCQKIPS